MAYDLNKYLKNGSGNKQYNLLEYLPKEAGSVADQIEASPLSDLGFDPETSDPSLRMKAAQYSPPSKYTNLDVKTGGLLPFGAPVQDVDWKKVGLNALFATPRIVLAPIAKAAGYEQTINPMLEAQMAPSNQAEKILGFGAEQVGSAPVYALSELLAGAPLAKATGKGLGKLGELLPKIAPAIEKATPYAQTFARGFGMGAPVETASAMGEGATLPEALKSGAETGAIFGGFNVAGMGAKNLFSYLRRPKTAKLAEKALEESGDLAGEGQGLKGALPEGVGAQKGLLREGSISAAKTQTPGKMEPTGRPGEYTQSFMAGAMESPAVNREVKDIIWWDLQPGEAGTYTRRTHSMLSKEAESLISKNPEAAYKHATSVETLANEPDLSVAIGIKLADHYQKLGKAEMADDVLNFTADHLTRAGQAVSAARMLERMSPAGIAKHMKIKLGELNKEGAKVYGKKWKDVALTDSEKEAISRLTKGDKAGYEKLYEQIQARIANELPATAMEKVNAWRHIAMLLNPKTQIRNVGGNMIMAAMRETAAKVSAGLQNVLLKPGERTQVFKAGKEYKDAAAAFYEANKKALLGTNKYQENIKLNMPNKRVFADHKIFGKTVSLEPVRKFTYKLLEMGDVPFFKRAYIDRLSSYAQAKGIKDFSKLPQEAFSTALKEAEQATYKDAHKISDALNKWKNPGVDAGIGDKALAFGTEALLPFTKTPINIIRRGLQYSPKGIIEGLHMWKSKKLAAEGIDEMAKGLTGTAIIGLGYLLAKSGVLTGKASEDADLKAYDTSTGNAPFSILGKYTYDWAQPFSVPLSVGVEIYNALKDDPLKVKQVEGIIQSDDGRWTQIAKSMTNAVVDALTASGDTVFNMSVLKSVKYLLGNQQGVMAGLADLPQNYASQFIPTLSSQLAGTIDPTARQTYVKGNWPASAKGVLLNKIPFASMTLLAKQTPYGEDIKRIQNPLGRAAAQFLSPGAISVNQGVDSAVDAELRRLNKESGLKTQFPTMVPNYIEKTQKYPRINLTPEETVQYQKRTGQLTQEAFKKLINSGNYTNTKADKSKNMSADEVKAKMLAEAISDAKAEAKAEIVKKKGY
ncbi:MAG: hypothetical protein M0Q43_10115, partial [Methanothrix sp.]|nr:hypothetical protein [Methanothrix sp.]